MIINLTLKKIKSNCPSCHGKEILIHKCDYCGIKVCSQCSVGRRVSYNEIRYLCRSCHNQLDMRLLGRIEEYEEALNPARNYYTYGTVTRTFNTFDSTWITN